MSGASAPRWVLRSLGDLTGQPEHGTQPVPQAWIQWLRETFPDAKITTEVPEPVPGQLEMLLERRKVVLRVGHFTRASLVAIAQGWVAALVAMSGVVGTGATLVLAGMTLLEQFKQLGEAFVELDEERGEHCTYVAVITARDENLRALGHYPDANQVCEAHQRVREHCWSAAP
jgi:hypothetical protein